MLHIIRLHTSPKEYSFSTTRRMKCYLVRTSKVFPYAELTKLYSYNTRKQSKSEIHIGTMSTYLFVHLSVIGNVIGKKRLTF